MIINYDRNPNLSTDQKLQSLMMSIQLALNEMPQNAPEINGLVDYVYPVGSYYHTSDSSFDPNKAWGGTWKLLGEGQVLLSAGASYKAGTQYGSNSKSYTPAGSNGSTTLTNAQMAHGHGFTQPSTPKLTHSITQPAFKTPALEHTGNSGAMSANSSFSGYFDLRRWGTASGSGVVNNSGIVTQSSVSATANAFAQASSNNGTVQRITISKDISHTHSISHTHAAAACTRSTNVGVSDHAATACTGGAVSNLSGADSTRTGHSHTFTGTEASINVMQASTAAYIWHRTA